MQTNYSLDDEKLILGNLIFDLDLLDDIVDLQPMHFSIYAHQVIFQTLRDMGNHQMSADLITLIRLLTEKKLLAKVGGEAYIYEMANSARLISLTAVAKRIIRDYKTRQLFSLGKRLVAETAGILSETQFDTLLENTEKSLTELNLNHSSDTNVNLDSILSQWLDDIECHQHANGVTGLPTGLTKLDEITSGYQNGDLILLAARPSMGKTALSLNMARAALEKSTAPVQYYSLEMPAKKILERFVSMLAGLPASKLSQPELVTEFEWAKIFQAISIITKEWKDRLLLDDSSYLTPQMLKSRVRRNVRKYGKPALIIVDYLQLISVPEMQNGNRNLEISHISATLKQIAKEVDCPVLALSQLNRYLEQRADKRPMNSDLRDSGALEQDADLIEFIYRDEVYNKDSQQKGIAEIIVSKHRNGKCGTVLSHFNGALSLFTDLKGVINEN
ncbi:replicative DNA helicase [Actinobacillus delphinicola]|uniref:Replicative DNA helicase n=2 Tax=Actinobacillus delphinicola TaxID=51161 RepID=A0A448TTN2_9PAST|nr:replicative DNA helicase [Actinobacillus delphinicola]